jgi:hypothetical protein
VGQPERTSRGARPRRSEDEDKLDEDLDQLVRAAGRGPLGGAAAVTSGAGAIIGIDWRYNGQPTPLALLAASMIALFVALALLAIGLRLRRDTTAYAREQQQQRLERDQLQARVTELEAELAVLRARLAAAERPRRRTDPGRSTARGRALTPVGEIRS